MDRVLGKCSLCGGLVTLPEAWCATIPPVPTCTNCGAHEKTKLPTIEMEGASPGRARQLAGNQPWGKYE